MNRARNPAAVLLVCGWAATVLAQAVPSGRAGPTGVRLAATTQPGSPPIVEPGQSEATTSVRPRDGGQFPQLVRLRYQVLFAWDPNRLPSLDGDALSSLCARLSQGNPGYFTALPTKASHSEANWIDGDRPGPGWKACLIAVEPEIPAGFPSGVNGLREKRRQRVDIPASLEREVQSWLRAMDELEGRSSAIYTGIRQEAQRAREELAGLDKSGQISDLARQRREIEITLATKAVRMKALAAKVDDIRMQVQKKVREDPVLVQLQAIAKVREEALRLVEGAVSKGKADEGRLKDAQLKSLEVKVQIAQREDAVVGAAGGELLSRLAAEQAMLSIDLAELQGKDGILKTTLRSLEATKAKLDSVVKGSSARMEAARPYVVHPVGEPETTPIKN